MKRSGTDCSELNLKSKNVNAVEKYKNKDEVSVFRPERANHRNSLPAQKVTSQASSWAALS